MSQTQDRMMQIARDLLQRTVDNKVKWSANSSTSFVLPFPSGALGVASIDKDGFAPWELALYDEQGAMVESVRSVGYDVAAALVADTTRDLLGQLYHAARSNALNIDVLLNRLSDEIAKTD